jgi:ABC-type branched-subunit amino acid transport system substrate-binding protein
VSEISAARVAVVGPFSGPRSAWGQLLIDAVAGAGDGVDWVLYDDQGDATLSGLRAAEVIRHGGYSAVLGHFNSRGARAALPRYADAGMACLLPLATEPGLTALAGGLVLRWCVTDDAQVHTLLSALASAGYHAIDVLTDGNAYMAALADRFRTAELPGVSVRRLPEHGVPEHQLGAVVVVAVHHAAAALARTLRARGFQGQLAFTDDCAVPEFAELAGEAAAGALITLQRGGAASRVDTAVTALAAALTASPWLTGRELVTAVKEHTAVAFTPAGEVAFDRWAVERLPATTVPRAA